MERQMNISIVITFVVFLFYYYFMSISHAIFSGIVLLAVILHVAYFGILDELRKLQNEIKDIKTEDKTGKE